MKKPRILNRVEDRGVLSFQMVDCDVSVANAIRRVILSEIPICCIRTESEAVNQCKIEINTSRLHNEILKQRLSCIPIHTTNLGLLPGKYVLVVDVANDTDHVMYVTSEHFKIKILIQEGEEGDGVADKFMSLEDTRTLFPPSQFGDFIDFVRLRPAHGDLPGERIKLEAQFSVSNALENSMFNVVSKCTYSNTIDTKKAEEVLETKKLEWKASGMSEEDIRFQSKNFALLDAQRYFVEGSYDFMVESIGIYDNWSLVEMAFEILKAQCQKMILALETKQILIVPNALGHLDINLPGIDYTFGKLWEYALYQKCFLEKSSLSFVSFYKPHPHDFTSFMRISLTNAVDDPYAILTESLQTLLTIL
jgi:DNA-directed RNA polymerase subunit L